VADVLTGTAKAMDAIHDDVLPANLGLAEAELVLGGKMGREMTLRRALREPGKHYDLILIDCPPSLGLLTVNALVAGDRGPDQPARLSTSRSRASSRRSRWWSWQRTASIPTSSGSGWC